MIISFAFLFVYLTTCDNKRLIFESLLFISYNGYAVNDSNGKKQKSI